jgi:hypothetical protein
MYTRVVSLHGERLTYIHFAGVARLALWAQWYEECGKAAGIRNEALIAACESTISFHEHDYVCRKLEFVTEMYALLESHNAVHAKMVTRDLEAMWAWTKGDFIMRLMQFVVGSDKVEVANCDVVREETEDVSGVACARRWVGD